MNVISEIFNYADSNVKISHDSRGVFIEAELPVTIHRRGHCLYLDPAQRSWADKMERTFMGFTILSMGLVLLIPCLLSGLAMGCFAATAILTPHLRLSPFRRNDARSVAMSDDEYLDFVPNYRFHTDWIALNYYLPPPFVPYMAKERWNIKNKRFCIRDIHMIAGCDLHVAGSELFATNSAKGVRVWKKSGIVTLSD